MLKAQLEYDLHVANKRIADLEQVIDGNNGEHHQAMDKLVTLEAETNKQLAAANQQVKSWTAECQFLRRILAVLVKPNE